MRWFLGFCLLLTACAHSDGGRNAFDLDSFYRHRHYDQVIPALESDLSQTKDVSEAVRIQLNLGLVYQAAGRYQDSARVFQAVEARLVTTDFIPLGEEVFAFVVNEKQKRFRLLEYEQLLLKAEMILNHVAAGEWELAMVENRSLDEALHRLRQQNEGFNHLESFYLSYLSGLVYEKLGRYDEAYIDYQRVWSGNPQFPGLREDLFRVAAKLGRTVEQARWVKFYELTSEEQQEIIRTMDYGEVVVLVQNGMAPFKTPHPYWPGVPMLQPRIAGAESAEVYVNAQSRGPTTTIFSVEDLALKIQWGKHQALVQKDMGRKIAQEVLLLPFDLLGGGFLAGVAARVVVHSLTGSPDLRTWDYLPRDWQIKRLRLSPGTHAVKVMYNYARGDMDDKTVVVRPRSLQFWSTRYGDSW